MEVQEKWESKQTCKHCFGRGYQTLVMCRGQKVKEIIPCKCLRKVKNEKVQTPDTTPKIS